MSVGALLSDIVACVKISVLAYLIYLLYFCFSSAGDLRRANGLLARYGFVLHEGGYPLVLVYNLLMKVCCFTHQFNFWICWISEFIILSKNFIHRILSQSHFQKFQGYISTGFPEAALSLHDEIIRHGLNLDKLTYNTLILACVEAGKVDAAMQFFEGMKVYL